MISPQDPTIVATAVGIVGRTHRTRNRPMLLIYVQSDVLAWMLP